MDYRLILYATISQYELKERFRRNDLTFDAWYSLSRELGYKSPSSLRKMCEPSSASNTSKLGFEDSMKIMRRCEDYRLLAFLEQELTQSQARTAQLDLFFDPLRTIKIEVEK